MDQNKKLEKIIDNAAANVACDTGDVYKETIKQVKDYLVNLSNNTEYSFIYELVKEVKKGQRHGK